VMRVSDSSLVNVDENTIVSNEVNDVSCGLLCEQQEVVSPKALDWRVFTQGTRYTKKYQGVDKVSLIDQGLSDITELIYQSYALLATAENDFVIEVNNVNSLTSDTQLFNLLTDLSAVNTVTLIRAQGGVRQFKLDLVGSKSSFLASLRLNNKLTQQFDGLLDGFSHAQQFNNPKNVSIDLNNSNTDQLKATALSETVQNSVAPPMTKLDVNVEETNPMVENSSNLNASSVDEIIKNDPLNVLPETVPPAPIVSPIPVFYWEQR
jgi:hypothetical protein